MNIGGVPIAVEPQVPVTVVRPFVGRSDPTQLETVLETLGAESAATEMMTTHIPCRELPAASAVVYLGALYPVRQLREVALPTAVVMYLYRRFFEM